MEKQKKLITIRTNVIFFFTVPNFLNFLLEIFFIYPIRAKHFAEKKMLKVDSAVSVFKFFLKRNFSSSFSGLNSKILAIKIFLRILEVSSA